MTQRQLALSFIGDRKPRKSATRQWPASDSNTAKYFVSFNPVEQKNKNSPRLTVLVADDEPDTVQTLAAILTDAGYAVVEAFKGPDVLRHVARSRPDALILDIDMPGMSGYTVAREIREVYQEDTPLLICISGKWIGQTDKMLADMAGFNHFCQKPCDPQVLLRWLEPLALTRRALIGSGEDSTVAPPGTKA